jgi:hypothetical protein
MCSLVALDYVVPSKAHVSHSSGRFVASLRGKWFSYRSEQADGSQRFCAHTYYGESRSSQMLTDLFLQFSALCFCFTTQDRKEIREKERKKRKGKKHLPSKWTSNCLSLLPAVMLYKKLI